MENCRISTTWLEDFTKLSMCDIKFDCVVTMYDLARKEIKQNLLANLFTVNKQPNISQWFTCENVLTLEFIRHAPEKEIGKSIKFMLKNLEEAIDGWKKR